MRSEVSPLPVEMRDRWLDRCEPGPGDGTIYWHILPGEHPALVGAVGQAQATLSQFSGLHMTPREWLHITTLEVGSVEGVSRAQLDSMLTVARREMRDVESVRVSFGKIYYHPEAVVFAVSPKNALAPLLAAAQVATQEVIGNPGLAESGWTPHLTIAYSTAGQSAGQVISALGPSVEEFEVVVDALTLVVQWGAERLWNWEPVGVAYCGRAGLDGE